MATVGTALTLTDLAKRLDPSTGKIGEIVEVLNKVNRILDDIPFVEGNMDVGHRHIIRAGLPPASWRLLNYGTQPAKGQTKQIDDMCGMLERVSDVDKALADLNGNKAAFRWSEDVAMIESMGQAAAKALIYGNQATDPEQITGLAPRYAVGKTAGNSGTSADNVLQGGGSGSVNTSIWLVNWGDRKVFGIYPKGTKAGLEQEDRGVVDLSDGNGGVYRGYRSYYTWRLGLAVADWRQIARIANVDVTALTKDAATGADLMTLMIKATHKIPDITVGNPIFYCNVDAYQYLDLQTLNSKNMNVSYADGPQGQRVMMFRGIPVHRCDAILSTESTVAFS